RNYVVPLLERKGLHIEPKRADTSIVQKPLDRLAQAQSCFHKTHTVGFARHIANGLYNDARASSELSDEHVEASLVEVTSNNPMALLNKLPNCRSTDATRSTGNDNGASIRN